MTWNRSGAGGSRVITARPILPPTCVSRPAARNMCPASAVVVDLPFVPVIARNGDPGATAARSRAKISMSPMISTPAPRASSTVQWGFGCVSGTPGDSTSDAKEDQSAVRRSAVAMPASAAFATLSGLSSQATTSAPPSSSARAVAVPEPPSPKSATRLPRKDRVGITSPPYLSFRLDRPISARMTAMIQNRTTTWLSVQPSFSK